MNDLKPTTRFSNRVENYVRFRPRYPQQIVAALAAECGLTVQSIVADIGSGTGILTENFLKDGNVCFAVEPNREMREAAEKILGEKPNFRSVDGTAEATTLPDASADFIVAGQAFHWFEPNATRAEFQRILRPSGWVALVWNRRQSVSRPFQDDYEALLREFAPEYSRVTHENVDNAALAAFFGGDFEQRHFQNAQRFDFESLQGRLLSSSYAPEVGQPNHAPLLEGLRAIFEKHQQNGVVGFEYQTELSFGQLKK